MPDNSTLPATGDTVRDLARSAGTVKTQVVQLDLGGASANAEVLITAGQQAMAASVPVVIANNQTAVPMAGNKTNNAAPPGATNGGSLDALANAATPSWTEGNQVAHSVDLAGSMRMVMRPPVILGAYRLAVQTPTYSALSAGAILFSFRWTDATKNCRVTRVRVAVNTTTAASASGMIDRDLVIVRGFTVADSGGTAITLTGNNQKARTSHATTVSGGIQLMAGGALTAGTGTADAQAIGLMTKQGTSTEPIGLTLPPEDLFAYNVGQNYPIILAANEGVRVRIPTAMPSSLAQRTTITIEWDEIAAASSF